MATELIGVKVEIDTKERILQLVESGKYRNLSDFMHRAIKSELEHSEVDEQTRFRELLIELLDTDPEINEILIRKKDSSRKFIKETR